MNMSNMEAVVQAPRRTTPQSPQTLRWWGRDGTWARAWARGGVPPRTQLSRPAPAPLMPCLNRGRISRSQGRHMVRCLRTTQYQHNQEWMRARTCVRTECSSRSTLYPPSSTLMMGIPPPPSAAKRRVGEKMCITKTQYHTNF